MVKPDTPVNAPSTLAGELQKLIDDAEDRASAGHLWARFWQVADITFGLAAAVLAAIAGAAGLATTAGRVPAAILALSAAGLAAANQFLRSGERYERNRKRRNAYQALECDARLEQAKAGKPPAESLYQVMRELLQRRIAIMDMDHQPVPPAALSVQACASAGSSHTGPRPEDGG